VSIPELDELEDLIEQLGDRVQVQVLARAGGFPVYGLVMGHEDATAPCLCLVGGVHGLERIGTQVVLAYLRTLAERLQWDLLTQEALRWSRVIAIPLLNPLGMLAGTRSNGNGVDLMRNGPTNVDGKAAFLVGGQRISPRLPWFMGQEGVLETESQALIDFVTKEVLPSEVAISLDVHSGFGFRDRLWFPYARTARPFPHTAEIYSLFELLDRTLPHHVYHAEPQSCAYTIAGDLWDFLYDRSREGSQGLFLPLTLEMGSWTWVRKNPRQLFSLLGTFNPIKHHRLRRTLRRHLLLIDFLHRAVIGRTAWAELEQSTRRRCLSLAVNRWFT
jgi:hypothetical protein